MIGFQLIFKHLTIVYVTGMSSKIASTHSQKWLTIFFLQKSFKNCISYDFVQILPNAYQIMNGETLGFQHKRQ